MTLTIHKNETIENRSRRKLRSRTLRSRRGVQVLEAILVIPLCLIVILAFFDFGILMTVHHAGLNVAVETARELSKVPQFDISDPNDLDEVSEVVNDILGIHGITLGEQGLLVIVEDANGFACLTGDTFMESRFCPSQTTITDDFEIKVTIVWLRENSPVPQLLRPFCVLDTDVYYQFCSIARRDC